MFHAKLEFQTLSYVVQMSTPWTTTCRNLPCRDFQETGSCRFGERCKFSHDNGFFLSRRNPRNDKEPPPKSAGDSKMFRSNKPCRDFEKTGTCTFGEDCRFSHQFSRPRSSSPAFNIARHSELNPNPDNGPTNLPHIGPFNKLPYAVQSSSADRIFRQWRYSIPKDGQPSQPLGRALPRFFKDALILVNSETNIMQEVLQKLATEGGLRRIKELIDGLRAQHSDIAKLTYFTSTVFPFLQLLSDPKVISSIILEQQVGTICNLLYGLHGRSYIAMFTFICDILNFSNVPTSPWKDSTVDIDLALATSLSVHARVIDLNSAASLNSEIPPIVEVLETIFKERCGDGLDSVMRQATMDLMRAQKRLGIASKLPMEKSRKKITPDVIPISFKIDADPPGHLSPHGARHDNDFADITKIQILPTFDEIQSMRSEYLPKMDPSTLHLSGAVGLLDRHFRLLREDTVGQLRDAVKAELSSLKAASMDQRVASTHSQGARTFTYANATINTPSFDRRGLNFKVSFDEPSKVRNLEKSKREEWWEHGKRLTEDSLVCILSATSAIFCTVVRKQSRNTEKENRHDRFARNPTVTLEDIPESNQRIVHRAKSIKQAHGVAIGSPLDSSQPQILDPRMAITRTSRRTHAPYTDLQFSGVDLKLDSEYNQTEHVPLIDGPSNDRRPFQHDPAIEIDLMEESNTASVLLKLVNNKEHDVKKVTAWAAQRSSYRLSLVEFPGVLLPAFDATLRALQTMSTRDDLPFCELLAPMESGDGSLIKVPPPAYALRTGFHFNLSTLMHNERILRLNVREPFPVKELQDGSDLDDAQAKALVSALSCSFASIQGPPGTGKSYTGVAIVRALLANKRAADLGPLITVTYTNHALDQFLEHTVEANVTHQIIRIGAQSKSVCLKDSTLRAVTDKSELTKTEKAKRWTLLKQLEDDEKEIKGCLTSMTRLHHWETIKGFLALEYPHHHNQLFGTEEGGWTKVNYHLEDIVEDWLYDQTFRHVQTGDMSPPILTTSTTIQRGSIAAVRSIEVLKSANIFSMAPNERQTLYRCWIGEIRSVEQAKLMAALDSWKETKHAADQIKTELDLRVLQQADIIGATTTGLAKNLDLLRRVRAKVLIVEEAGEILEAHTLTALLPSIEHVILIGDHLQLRPAVQNYGLQRENPRGAQYSLDVSLFERLVAPLRTEDIRLPFSTLETQRRMHPSIADLIRKTLYNQLQDAPSVSRYPPVAGMRHRLFWLDHKHPEVGAAASESTHTTSHSNVWEIDMTAALVSHLIRQGAYKEGDIAVLTPYLGQLTKLRRQLASSFEIVLNDRDMDDLEKEGADDFEDTRVQVLTRTSLLRTLRVATIDNFQGEEAKVVIISLVRSNEEGKCGFLKTSNRINVLLSRAQHGMYIIGNAQTSIHVPMWRDVMDLLKAGDNIGLYFELECPRHPDTPIVVSTPEDFHRFSPEGGCDLMCSSRLLCGHRCISKCHSEHLHSSVYCLERCQKILPGCNHGCPNLCGDKCIQQCQVRIPDPERMLPCGHLAPNLTCWFAQDLSRVRCKETQTVTVPGCSHEVQILCYQDVTTDNFKCPMLCGAALPCGHTCKKNCHQCRMTDPNGRVTITHEECTQPCGRQYTTCSHGDQTPCHGEEPCVSCKAQCDVFCVHSKCSKVCSEPCAPCVADSCASGCSHSACTQPCSAPCDWVPCSFRCPVLLRCGHQCPSLCGEACPSTANCQVCGLQDIKDVVVDYIEMKTFAEMNLYENPCVFLNCGHIFARNTLDGQMDFHKYFNTTRDGRVLSVKENTEPFSMNELKTCPLCRGSLRNIGRYGRIVRRAMLDESTKKFIVWSNRAYVPLAESFQKAQKLLHNSVKDINEVIFFQAGDLHLGESRGATLRDIRKGCTLPRYKAILKVRSQISEYMKKVAIEEQPFKRVWYAVQWAKQRKNIQSDFEIDSSVLQTRGYLLASALLLRCDLTILADFLGLRHRVAHLGTTTVDLSAFKFDCDTLARLATESSHPLQQAEGLLFVAHCAALERLFSTQDVDSSDHLRQQGISFIEVVKEICESHPFETRLIHNELKEIENMLNDGTFHGVMTDNEWKTVLAAMATELTGTGHWYHCANGHPFTIGECGMPMERAQCPQCGATIGGQNHVSVEGVARAENLDELLRDMNLGR
ncbi:hypothetical protein M501DRAFT_995498 [Patellaria atrata CBS 101060]|uniref:NFX1-type zinc finger-containing protein 1 n=1 Tax=Patellaria atrata CBS 101060 TaxID=1346257 RepID=A0A9P4S7L9_9PEZI|nr:hypothetical protein M501DRAFT_995498 [Patellaria atrata CBS 101060]